MEESCPFAEKQSVYSIAPVDRAIEISGVIFIMEIIMHVIVGFECNVVCSCLFLSVYTRVFKNIIECVDFSCANLIDLYIIRKFFNFVFPPVLVINVSCVKEAVILNFWVDVRVFKLVYVNVVYEETATAPMVHRIVL